MNHDWVANIFSGICGVFGFGIMHTTLQIQPHDELIKFIISCVTAFFAGALGYAGKIALSAIFKKVKKIFKP